MNYCPVCDTIYYDAECRYHGPQSVTAPSPMLPRHSVGRVFPIMLDDTTVEAQILSITSSHARIAVYGPGEYGHVSARTIPIEEIP